MIVKKFLEGKYTNETDYFILDSHEEAKGLLQHSDKDFVHYSYDTRRYNKLKEGDIFLYRVPKKTSKNRKFNFYGGGIIKNIQKEDNNGRVKAIVENGFKLCTILYEDSPEVTSMKWTFKKKGDNWEHFWGQYGMNKINATDFFNLVGNLECIAAEECSTREVVTEEEVNEEKNEVLEEVFDGNYAIIQHQENQKPLERKIGGKKKHSTKKVDYDKLNKAKHTIGDLGEYIVLEMEKDYLVREGREDLANDVVHASKENGDGDGYDILSFDKDGNQKLIEVKTTKTNKVDGFYISPNEIKVASENSDKYYIYRLYNLDIKNHKGDLRVFEGKVDSDKYHLEPVAYKVTLK